MEGAHTSLLIKWMHQMMAIVSLLCHVVVTNKGEWECATCTL